MTRGTGADRFRQSRSRASDARQQPSAAARCAVSRIPLSGFIPLNASLLSGVYAIAKMVGVIFEESMHRAHELAYFGVDHRRVITYSNRSEHVMVRSVTTDSPK